MIEPFRGFTLQSGQITKFSSGGFLATISLRVANAAVIKGAVLGLPVALQLTTNQTCRDHLRNSRLELA
ncbi:hypothetical protein [Synechococcus sp. M16CYN]|uniref:hypothetical protein n=1 Tax=Synechococcus sp. M16CYN TaxID=3103139 RepID=UPI00334236D0